MDTQMDPKMEATSTSKLTHFGPRSDPVGCSRTQEDESRIQKKVEPGTPSKREREREKERLEDVQQVVQDVRET